MSGLPGSRSQTHVHTFATNLWHFQTFQTKIRHFQALATKTWHFQTFATMMIYCDYRAEAEVARPKHRDSYLVCPDSRDQELPFPDFRDRKTKARQNFGTLKKLLDGFVRKSSMPAVFSRRDTNLRVFASFEARFERFFRRLRSKSCFKISGF